VLDRAEIEATGEGQQFQRRVPGAWRAQAAFVQQPRTDPGEKEEHRREAVDEPGAGERQQHCRQLFLAA